MAAEYQDLTASDILALDREHVIHSWSTQALSDPLSVAGAAVRHFWDFDGRDPAGRETGLAHGVRLSPETAIRSALLTRLSEGMPPDPEAP